MYIDVHIEQLVFGRVVALVSRKLYEWRHTRNIKKEGRKEASVHQKEGDHEHVTAVNGELSHADRKKVPHGNAAPSRDGH